jgi:DNA-binding transcriptional ArsR family regulator
MESVLWYMLAGARGGPNRIRILRALDERPRNANQLAEDLDLDYTTIRHHLDVLMEHDVVENSGGGYGTVYVPTDRVEDNWATVEEIIRTVNHE